MNSISGFNQLRFCFQESSGNGTASAFTPHVTETTTLAQKVRFALLNEVALNETSIRVLPINGHGVELTGAVGSHFEKRRALDVARTTNGVYEVMDNLRIQ